MEEEKYLVPGCRSLTSRGDRPHTRNPPTQPPQGARTLAQGARTLAQGPFRQAGRLENLCPAPPQSYQEDQAFIWTSPACLV
ncbi:hypothetical protein NHX12_011611 [Muraenolepis orangiensis]|uniref:Uncharacterized protein n=1 Tax=Muraenolepis orangiensis TaxID=630683 RepID=A0A9Q0DK07_9TELE|nr:hypothetical protein NHX12_011611 [Muraenolepis orangiensis]